MSANKVSIRSIKELMRAKNEKRKQRQTYNLERDIKQEPRKKRSAVSLEAQYECEQSEYSFHKRTDESQE